MVYLTVQELGWRPYVKTWLETYFVERRDPDTADLIEEAMSDALKEHIWNNFDYTIDPGLEFIRSEKCSEGIKTTDLQ